MDLKTIVPWGRSYDEYVRMFDLQDPELDKRILGCADGPASFNAEMRRRGKSVVSIDPLYAFSKEEIGCRIDEVFDMMVEKANANANAFVWNHIHSPEHLGATRASAMNLFLDDYSDGVKEGRYIAASLPHLPFPDQAFDLAICSHYLFTYSNFLTEQEHIEAVAEMVRVAVEVRIFPLVEMFNGGPSQHIEAVVTRFSQAGGRATKKTVPYEFQRGGNEMLVVVRGS